MKRRAALALLLAVPFATGCPEPPKIAQMDDMVQNLANLSKWHPVMMAKGQLTFDSVMGYGPDIFPVLVDHLIDETPTTIYDEMSGRNPLLCDVVLLMLLELFQMKWQEFSKDGLFIATALDNPLYSIKWDRQAKFKVQKHFRRLLEEMDIKH